MITEPQYWRSSETAFSEYEILPEDFPETEDMAPEPLEFRGNSFETFRIDDLADL